jgi:hypothetical protein
MENSQHMGLILLLFLLLAVATKDLKPYIEPYQIEFGEKHASVSIINHICTLYAYRSWRIKTIWVKQ